MSVLRPFHLIDQLVFTAQSSYILPFSSVVLLAEPYFICTTDRLNEYILTKHRHDVIHSCAAVVLKQV